MGVRGNRDGWVGRGERGGAGPCTYPLLFLFPKLVPWPSIVCMSVWARGGGNAEATRKEERQFMDGFWPGGEFLGWSLHRFEESLEEEGLRLVWGP